MSGRCEYRGPLDGYRCTFRAGHGDEHETTTDCEHECEWVEPYGWVPEADCPIHDAPVSSPPEGEGR